MRGKGIYIFLLIIIIVFGVIMFLLFGKSELKQETHSATLLVGDNTIWTLNNKQWLNESYTSSIDNYNWKKYYVYTDNKYKGKLKLWHDDTWYAFDNKNNALDLNGNLFAYNSNYKIKVADFTEEQVQLDNNVNQILLDNNITQISNLTKLTKTSLDIDNDGTKEDFYIVSNAFPDDQTTSDKYFSIVFMVKDNKLYQIYDNIKKSYYSTCMPFFTSFLDIDEDNNYELILSCGKYSDQGEDDMLYKYTDKGFNMLISNN